MVGLKYCSATIKCDQVIDGEGGAGALPAELRCSIEDLDADRPKPKGNISWVSAEEAVRAEVRLYSHLFTVDSPDDKWEEQVSSILQTLHIYLLEK